MFEIPSKRRELKSPLPTIEPGSKLFVPTTGTCMHERSDNTCIWSDSAANRCNCSIFYIMLSIAIVMLFHWFELQASV